LGRSFIAARCLFDVVLCIAYEVAAWWFEGQRWGTSIYESLQGYRRDFPALDLELGQAVTTVQGRAFREISVQDISIDVICRKAKDAPFRGALDSTTSVGAIPRELTAAYGSGAGTGAVTGSRRHVTAALQDHPRQYGIDRRLCRAAYRT
jgi:hypothetical protein